MAISNGYGPLAALDRYSGHSKGPGQIATAKHPLPGVEPVAAAVHGYHGPTICAIGASPIRLAGRRIALSSREH